MAARPFCGLAESRGAPLHLVTAVMSSGPSEDIKRLRSAEHAQIEAHAARPTTNGHTGVWLRCSAAELELTSSLHSVSNLTCCISS